MRAVPRRYTYLPIPDCAVRVSGYNRDMRRQAISALLFAAMACLVAAAEHKSEPMMPCPPGMSDAVCHPSRQDQKDAAKAFDRGRKLQAKDLDAAYEEFIHAADLVPRNVDYVTAREAVRQ